MKFRSIPLALASASLFGCSRGAPSGSDGPLSSPDQAGAALDKSGPGIPSVLTLADRDPPEAKVARKRLVRDVETGGEPWDSSGPWDPRVLGALASVPRHLFMPGTSLREAYEDRPVFIGYGQTISQPTVVAIMTDALELTGTERVLEIGTGSGYQAAVLSMLAGEVFSIELLDALGQTARARLAELGYSNVRVRIGDGYQGWPEHAPFDRIVLTAAPPEIPRPLVEQLKDGGILVAPVGDQITQRLVRWTKRGEELVKEDLGAVRFVPMVKQDPTAKPN